MSNTLTNTFRSSELSSVPAHSDTSFFVLPDYERVFLGNRYTLIPSQRDFSSSVIFISINESEKTINQFNQAHLIELMTKKTPLLISLIKNEDFEYGQNSESIRLVENELKKNSIVANEWFNRLFLQYFASSTKTDVLIGLLRIVEFLSDRFDPTYKTIALASFNHANNEVKELGVRILETSCSSDNLKILKNVHVDTKWLQDYINQVIKDFEQALCPS